MSVTFSTLEELALRRGVTVRTAQRWLAAGRVERVVLDDGTPAFRLSDSTSDRPSDTAADRTERENPVSDNDMSDIDAASEADRSEPPRRVRPVDPTGTATTAAARVTRRVRDLVGASYVATLDTAEAVAALVAYAQEQAAYERAFTSVEPSPGQPGDVEWTAIAEAVTACATELQGLLDRREVDDPTLARVNLALRDAERRWRAARAWEMAHVPDDEFIEPLRQRTANELATFARAFESLRRALTE
jgi:hypothetical protein